MATFHANSTSSVFENMKILCRIYFPKELAEVTARYSGLANGATAAGAKESNDDEEEEEEEEEPL